MNEENKEMPFTFDEVESIRVIVRAKGKNYSTVVKKQLLIDGDDKQRALPRFSEEAENKKFALEVLKQVVSKLFDIVTPSLEEIGDKYLRAAQFGEGTQDDIKLGREIFNDKCVCGVKTAGECLEHCDRLLKK